MRGRCSSGNFLEAGKDGCGRGINDGGIAVQACDSRFMPSHFRIGQERSTMEMDGVIGVLERVSCEEQHDGLSSCNLALCEQFFQPGKRDGGSWFAAETFRADLRLGDSNLSLTYIETPAP